MPTELTIPKLGLTMREGTIARWLVPDGSRVTAGTPVVLIETDKVEAEVEAPADGVLHQTVAVGTTLEPGAGVGWVVADGEAVPGARPGTRRFVSPNARRRAGELGVDLSLVQGTGPGGRVVSEDVEDMVTMRPAAAASIDTMQPAPSASLAPPPVAPPATERDQVPAGSAPPATVAAVMAASRLGIDLATVRPRRPDHGITRADVEAAATALPVPLAAPAPAPSAAIERRPGDRIAVKGMRRTIGQRMKASLDTTAQLTLAMEADMVRAVDLREQLKGAGLDVVPSYTDLVIAAVARALRRHPLVNASMVGPDRGSKEIELHTDVHVGMAVALDEGLIVPVVKHADRLPLVDLAVETSRLAALARDGKVGVDDVTGSTFTVSALGMFGVDLFTPIINTPNAAILGVGRVRDEVRWELDRPVRGRSMTLSLTWDHRVFDGAPAARFTQTVCELLAAPAQLLV